MAKALALLACLFSCADAQLKFTKPVSRINNNKLQGSSPCGSSATNELVRLANGTVRMAYLVEGAPETKTISFATNIEGNVTLRLVKYSTKTKVASTSNLGSFRLAGGNRNTNFNISLTKDHVCRPNTMCALQLEMVHRSGAEPFSPYYSCADVRVFTTANHRKVTLTVSMLDGDTVKLPLLISEKLLFQKVNNQDRGIPGFSANAYEVVEKDSFKLYDKSKYDINIILKDTVGFPVETLEAKLADPKELQKLGLYSPVTLKSVALNTGNEDDGGIGGAGAFGIFFVIMVILIGGSVVLRMKNPELWDKVICCEKLKTVQGRAALP